MQNKIDGLTNDIASFKTKLDDNATIIAELNVRLTGTPNFSHRSLHYLQAKVASISEERDHAQNESTKLSDQIATLQSQSSQKASEVSSREQAWTEEKKDFELKLKQAASDVSAASSAKVIGDGAEI